MPQLSEVKRVQGEGPGVNQWQRLANVLLSVQDSDDEGKIFGWMACTDGKKRE